MNILFKIRLFVWRIKYNWNEKRLLAEYSELHRCAETSKGDGWKECDIDELHDGMGEAVPGPTEPGLWQCTKNGANHIIDVAEDLTYPAYCKGGQWTKVEL